MTLDKYIKDNYASKADFARSQNMSRQQVNEWLSKDFIVVEGKLYSYRRELK